MDFPPLAERPDELESEEDLDLEEISPVVLDVLSVASERGLNISETLELAQCCLASVVNRLCEQTEALPQDEVVELWMAIGRLEAASDILDSVEIEEEGE
jgi:hypothetical protein